MSRQGRSPTSQPARYTKPCEACNGSGLSKSAVERRQVSTEANTHAADLQCGVCKGRGRVVDWSIPPGGIL